jgi:hypothetical protein
MTLIDTKIPADDYDFGNIKNLNISNVNLNKASDKTTKEKDYNTIQQWFKKQFSIHGK